MRGGCTHALEPLAFWSVMVTDPDSSHGGQTTTPPSEPRAPGEGEGRQESEPFWSWLRFVVLLAVAIGLGVWGYLLRPSTAKPLSVNEPTISILASEQDVTATVDMTLSSEVGQTPPYSLTLTITPTNPSQVVKFAVSFGGFPAPAPGTGPDLHMSQNAYYAVINSTPGLSGAASQSPPFPFKSSQPIGENSKGAQLRVAFPDLAGETPGSQYSAQACAAGSITKKAYATICSQLGNQPQWYTPALEAGTTTFSSTDPGLNDYQVLAGDNPTLLGGNKWMWSGINGVTMLAADVPAQDNEQNDLFYAGLLLGVAASAGIACVTELLRPAWRK